MQYLVKTFQSDDTGFLYDAIDWPKGTSLVQYDLSGECPRKLFKTHDIVDQTMAWRSVNAYRLGVKIKNIQWVQWSPSALEAIEGYFKYTFEFEALKVKHRRVSSVPKNCSEEMVWELEISPQ